MDIYDINEEWRKLWAEAIDAETGVIDEEKMAAFEQLDADRASKMRGLVRYYQELKAEAGAIKGEADRIRAKAQTAERKVDSLKQYIAGALEGEPYKDKEAGINCYYTSNTKCVVDDISKIPEKYIRRPDPEAKLTEIKAAINKGDTVAGAHLVTSSSLVIRG